MSDERAGSLATGLRVLELLCAYPEGLGVTELAQQVAKDKGNLHRLLQALDESGYVHQDPVTKRFHATVQIASMAASVLRGHALLEVARPILADLLRQTGETIHLAERTRRGGVYIAQERPAGRLSIMSEIGAPVPLHCTSTGKALLLDMAPDRIAQLLPEPLSRPTLRTHGTLTSLLRDLEASRARGWTVDDQESYEGIRCVGVPVRAGTEAVIAALSVSGPDDRMPWERLDEVAGLLLAAAGRLERALMPG